mgnify:CR=1 FL=1
MFKPENIEKLKSCGVSFLDSPTEIPRRKREVARILTVMREREITAHENQAEGV